MKKKLLFIFSMSIMGSFVQASEGSSTLTPRSTTTIQNTWLTRAMRSTAVKEFITKHPNYTVTGSGKFPYASQQDIEDDLSTSATSKLFSVTLTFKASESSEELSRQINVIPDDFNGLNFKQTEAEATSATAS